MSQHGDQIWSGPRNVTVKGSDLQELTTQLSDTAMVYGANMARVHVLHRGVLRRFCGAYFVLGFSVALGCAPLAVALCTVAGISSLWLLVPVAALQLAYSLLVRRAWRLVPSGEDIVREERYR